MPKHGHVAEPVELREERTRLHERVQYQPFAGLERVHTFHDDGVRLATVGQKLPHVEVSAAGVGFLPPVPDAGIVRRKPEHARTLPEIRPGVHDKGHDAPAGEVVQCGVRGGPLR